MAIIEKTKIVTHRNFELINISAEPIIANSLFTITHKKKAVGIEKKSDAKNPIILASKEPSFSLDFVRCFIDYNKFRQTETCKATSFKWVIGLFTHQ